MDKLLKDMEAFCKLIAGEREERYRKSCRIAEISEIFTGWEEQQLTDGEMARIRTRDDMVQDILFHDREIEDPCYGKTCNETLKDAEDSFDKILRNMVDELQGMVELFQYMDMAKDKDMNDLLNLLETNLSAYNIERRGYDGQ